MTSTTAPVSYRVEGMTCAHCVSTVTSELTGLDGIDDVTVDLEAGIVTVTGSAAEHESTISSTVDEAGYSLVGRA